MPNTTTLWTIGHSNRSKDAFLNLLNEHRIQTLVDVRRFPTSKIEHFKRENMEKWLKQDGIEYVWLGKELGGYRKGGYKRHMKTKLFRTGVEQLLTIAKQERTCIMCMETDPKHCHRRFLSAILEKKGVTVIHVLCEGQKSLINI